ncbi:MAG TPA: alpha/beta hydrolase [Candidatus Sulfotelmatobacter sp.]|nr:alpha/beta hydrolase [Candidatus Sulfotelmatobacter sp.]
MTNSASRSTSHPVFRRIVLLLLAFLLLLAVAGFLYENISEARDRRFNPMQGRVLDVGGRKMHIECTGEGSPTVILDSGLGDSSLSWRKVQPQIAKFTRACSYDRAGLGYSDPSSKPRTSNVIAQELHALLQAARVSPPYVIVGHSMGGYNVRVYTSLYRNEIVGMVLVDASHPDQENRFPAELKNMEGSWHREAQFVAYTMPFGIPRLLGLCENDAVTRAADCNWHSAREQLAEISAFSESAAETASTGSLSDLPLAVLSHDPDKPSSDLPPDLAKTTNEAWEKMQEELAHLSTRGTQTVAKSSAHYIQIDRPDVVMDAVRNVVDQARPVQSQSAPANR